MEIFSRSPEDEENEIITNESVTVGEVESPVKFQKSKCKSFLDWAMPESLDLKNIPKPTTPPKKYNNRNNFNTKFKTSFSRISVSKHRENLQRKNAHVNLNSLYTNDMEADKENLEPNSSPCAKKPKKKTAKRNIVNSLNATETKKKKEQKGLLKRKPLQQISGQLQLTSFFNMRN